MFQPLPPGKAVCLTIPWVYTCVCVWAHVCASSCEDSRVWKISDLISRNQVKEQKQEVLLWADSTSLEEGLRSLISKKKVFALRFSVCFEIPWIEKMNKLLLCYISGSRKLSVERGTLQRPWDAWMLCSIRFIQGMHLILIFLIIIIIIISLDGIKCVIWVIGDYGDWQTVFMLLVIAPQS